MRAEPGANGADLETKHELLMFFPLKAKTITNHHIIRFFFFFVMGSLTRFLTSKKTLAAKKICKSFEARADFVYFYFFGERAKQTERKRRTEVQYAI